MKDAIGMAIGAMVGVVCLLGSVSVIEFFELGLGYYYYLIGGLGLDSISTVNQVLFSVEQSTRRMRLEWQLEQWSAWSVYLDLSLSLNSWSLCLLFLAFGLRRVSLPTKPANFSKIFRQDNGAFTRVITVGLNVSLDGIFALIVIFVLIMILLLNDVVASVLSQVAADNTRFLLGPLAFHAIMRLSLIHI